MKSDDYRFEFVEKLNDVSFIYKMLFRKYLNNINLLYDHDRPA